MKTQSMIVTVALAITTALPITAWAKNQALKPLKTDYLAIQTALASDDLSRAKAAAGKLKSAVKKHDTKKSDPAMWASVEKLASEIASAKSIDDARESFKALSERFISDQGDVSDKDTDVVSCSMANAKWIQKKGEIRNPYYGKSMLTCGERS